MSCRHNWCKFPSLALKVLPSRGNDVPAAVRKFVHHMGKVLCRDSVHFLSDCQLQRCDRRVPHSPDLGFEFPKEPVVAGVEVRGVRRVWQGGDIMVLQVSDS